MQRGARIGAAIFALIAAALILIVGGSDVAKADLSYEATQATITVDGNPDDWADIPALDLTLVNPFDPTRTVQAHLKVAYDSQNIYVLGMIDDDYNSTPGEHELSGAYAVLLPVESGAGPHMGTDGVNIAASLGMVDIWHWEIDCGPGVVSGGIDREEDGNDPACNLDDEWATTPFEREDDDLNNFLTGVYDHSNRAAGEDAQGTWYWEISRPLQTGDPQDAQIEVGSSVLMALAYWDADETENGWTDAGHMVTAGEGWIEVSLGVAAATPTPAPTPTPAATATPAPTATPAAPPTTGGSPGGDDGISAGVYALVALGGLAALAGIGAIVRRVYRRRA